MTQLVASQCCALLCTYLPGKALGNSQIYRRKLLLLSATYIPVVSLFDHRNPPCCASAKVRTDEERSILYEEVFLSVTYLSVSLKWKL